MTERKRHHEIPVEHRAQEHLANERTFLAWVRTAIALIGLGFVLARAGPLLVGGPNVHRVTVKLTALGVGLVTFGAVITILSAWRYDAVNREIDAGLVTTDRALVWLVAIVFVAISIGLVIYMLSTPTA